MHVIAAVYGIAFIAIGIAHFRSPDGFVEIIPAFLPFPLFLVYLSGAMETDLGCTKHIATRLRGNSTSPTPSNRGWEILMRSI